MIPSSTLRKIALACAALGSLASLPAETILQTTYNPGTSTWNNSVIWDGNNVVGTNDYQTVPDPARYPSGTPYETTFTTVVGGVSKTWAYFAQVRDAGSTAFTANSSFNGNRLILASGTRLVSKNRGFTTTVNVTLQDNSYMFLSPNSTTAGTSTWAGSIALSGNTLIGAEIQNSLPTILDVTSDISGSGTLTLTGKGALAMSLSLTGDLSEFTGTFLLTSVTGKTATPLTFSIANSATAATLQLNYESSLTLFRYDLSTNNVSFSSLVLGAGETAQVLGIGTYDAAYLNGLTGNNGIFTGIGTITVVPEPSTYAITMVGLLGILAATRRRKSRLS